VNRSKRLVMSRLAGYLTEGAGGVLLPPRAALSDAEDIPWPVQKEPEAVLLAVKRRKQ